MTAAKGDTKKVRATKARFNDTKGSSLVVSRQPRKDGQWVVKARYTKAGQKPQTGMVFILPSEEKAKSRFDEIVATATKAKWERKERGQAGTPKSSFDTIPAAL